jgi:hypothetical protein
VSEQSEPVAEVPVVRNRGPRLSWRLGIYCGAVVGGIFWGVVILCTIATPDGAPWQTSMNAGQVHRMLIVTAIWAALVIVGGAGIWLGRSRVLRSLGLALVVGLTSGWLILGSIVLQRQLAMWR